MKVTASFSCQPSCRPSHGGLMELDHDWTFFVGSTPYLIPAAWYFDGASIPRLFWSIIGSPFDPRFWAASATHDFLYTVHWFPRLVCDEIFRQFLVASGAGRARAAIMKKAVNAFGWACWPNSERDIIELMKFGLAKGKY